MILSKHSVIKKKLSKFGNKIFLTEGIPSVAEPTVLENSSVAYTFSTNTLKGAFLESIEDKISGITYTNSSLNLWRIGLIEKIETSPTLEHYEEEYRTIFPSGKNFTLSRTSPSGSQLLTLTWTNISYDRLYTDKRLKVTLTCTLEDTSPELKFLLKVEMVPGSPVADLNKGTVIAAVGYPELTLKGDSDIWETDVMVIGSLFGQCYRNPIKNFTSPRFEKESTARAQYLLDDTTKTYKFYKGGEGAGASPAGNTNVLSLGSPGYLSVPLFIYGNRTNKAGLLYYAADPEGIHAKNMQVYSDGEALHFRAWDLSDFEIDAFGAGGKWDNSSTYNTTNQLGWEIRIRPFKSPTKWVEWYGCKVYKEYVVPEQEAQGWMPESFYDRYLNEDLELRDIEVPFYTTANGALSGDAGDVWDMANYYKGLYSGLSLTDTPPNVPIHIQEVVYNIDILKNQSKQYFGWTTYGTGNSGIATYKSPDIYMNSVFSGASYSGAVIDGTIGMFYSAFQPRMSAYSDYVTGVLDGGIDVIVKSKATTNKTYTTSDFDDYISNTSLTENPIFSQYWKTCIGINQNRLKMIDTVRGICQNGGGIYHDTLGHWGGFGCYSNYHNYSVSGDAPAVGNLEHPRSMFSYYFNNVQRELLSGYTTILNDEKVGTKNQSFTQGSEFFSDAQLGYIPHAINLSNSSVAEVKTYLRYTTEPTRDDFIAEIELVPGILVAAFRKADPWKLSVPVANIIYGDRLVFADFLEPVISNSLDVTGNYITAQSVSGWNSLGVMVNTAADHSGRVQQLRNIASSQFSEFNRLTVYHQSLDFLDWDSTAGRTGTNLSWSGLTTEDHAAFMEGPAWSGYYDYIKSFIRIQAYEPDYVFHGRLEYPLDDYTSPWSSGVFIAHAFKDSNKSFSEPTGFLEEGIHHTLRRNRNGTNLLINFTNWTDNTLNFSGTFDPVAYDIGSSFEVYSLELTGSNAGTKTYLDTHTLNEPYVFDLDIEGATTLAYEIVAATSLRESDTYNDFTSSFANIRYDYSNNVVSTYPTTISYAYGSQCDSTVTEEYQGTPSPSTQAIVNNLPQWMEMRKNRSSDGWKLVNSWGTNLEAVLEDAGELLPNLFLETADTNLLSKIYFLDIKEEEVYKLRKNRNLLFNSSFSIRDIARVNLPAGWTNYGKGLAEYSIGKSLIGLSVSLTNSCLSQTIDVSERISYITGSVYIKAPTSSPSVKLILSVEKLDGTSLSSEAQLVSRSNEWRRLALPMYINEEVYRIRLTVVSNGNNTIYISAPQLEKSSGATEWTKSEKDLLPWINSSSIGLNLIQAITTDETSQRIPIYPIGSESDFLTVVIPTRVKRITSPINDLSPVSSQEFGREVSYYGEVYNTQWLVNSNYIEKRSVYPNEFDIFGRYSIKELRFTEDNNYGTKELCGVSINVIASAIRQRILYVICKEVTETKTLYTLKIVRPYSPPNGEDYLESLCDFNIDIVENNIFGFDQLEKEVTSIGFSDTDPSLLVINTNIGKQLIYKLYFDYYHFNPLNGRVYTLENYKGSKIQIL